MNKYQREARDKALSMMSGLSHSVSRDQRMFINHITFTVNVSTFKEYELIWSYYVADIYMGDWRDLAINAFLKHVFADMRIMRRLAND